MAASKWHWEVSVWEQSPCTTGKHIQTHMLASRIAWLASCPCICSCFLQEVACPAFCHLAMCKPARQGILPTQPAFQRSCGPCFGGGVLGKRCICIDTLINVCPPLMFCVCHKRFRSLYTDTYLFPAKHLHF
jgi:hypothetical protein